jgi:carbon-monoxide dehydrogenase small subunit
MKIPINIKVNGHAYNLDAEPHRTLLDIIRDDLGFTGTNRGCGEGDCGCCTVLINGKSANSCLILAPEADGAEIVTIEGLAEKGALHPVQRAFIEEGAIQCGYCTPGMVMQAVDFLGRNPDPSEEEARRGIEGNLCRCTGYAKIVKAILNAAGKMKTEKTPAVSGGARKRGGAR